MIAESKTATFIRGLVKFVFIGCYAAFMWASIHHVATFFNNFEQVNNTVGSFMLAGAFDITALVTTIGVMFFRKNMPRYVQWIVWVFIVAIASYSFFINWEYAAHFQNVDLVLQSTGETTPMYDMQGHVQYIPVMKANTALLVINPLLASGFTVFSLIYSIVAEFFGTKAPTIEELKAKQTYLEETATVLESIKQLEQKGKGKGLIQSAKDKALELKSAVKEVTKKEEIREETGRQDERHTDEIEAITDEETTSIPQEHFTLNTEESIIANHYEHTRSWLTTSGSTIPLKTVSETMNLSMKLLHNRVANKRIRATKNKEIVYKSSLVKWAISELIPAESIKIVHLNPKRNSEPSAEETTERETANV